MSICLHLICLYNKLFNRGGIMKKICGFVLLALLFFINIDVKALTANELKEKILGTIEVGGHTYTLDDNQKVIVERYFNENTISDADATYIEARINTAISIIQGEGNVNFTNYSPSTKQALKDLVKEIYLNTSVKATLTSEGLEILNSDNTKVLINGPIKQTGYTESIMPIAVSLSLFIVIAGMFLMLRQVKLVNNNE